MSTCVLYCEQDKDCRVSEDFICTEHSSVLHSSLHASFTWCVIGTRNLEIWAENRRNEGHVCMTVQSGITAFALL